MTIHRRLLLLASAVVSACVTNPENYKPAGFDSAGEARAYVPEYLYYAKKLTSKDWEDFYNRFPEYWKDVQTARQFGSTVDFHPWYSAYAFRWTTLRRKASWPAPTLERLARQEVEPGDDAFQVVFALGPPGRVIWDNDFEVLAYASGKALIFDSGRLARIASCAGCDVARREERRDEGRVGMTDIEVLDALKLARPRY
jgi:hypothetical protein